MRARLREEAAVFALAAQFLTRFPIPAVTWTAARMAATPRWYPLVGVLIGGVAGVIYWLAAKVFDPTLAALISTAAGLLLTGCLHEDGLADTCDGLGGGATAERALAIMRDSRIGTYGAAGLGFMLGAKVLCLGSMPPSLVPFTLIAGHAASRAACVVVMTTSRYVRADGAGAPVAGGRPGGGLLVALVTALAALAVSGLAASQATLGGRRGVIVGYWLMRRAFERRLDGYTGDCLGAVQQASETGFYLGFLACL